MTGPVSDERWAEMAAQLAQRRPHPGVGVHLQRRSRFDLLDREQFDRTGWDITIQHGTVVRDERRRTLAAAVVCALGALWRGARP